MTTEAFVAGRARAVACSNSLDKPCSKTRRIAEVLQPQRKLINITCSLKTVTQSLIKHLYLDSVNQVIPYQSDR